jgi:hypothetical protein
MSVCLHRIDGAAASGKRTKQYSLEHIQANVFETKRDW